MRSYCMYKRSCPFFRYTGFLNSSQDFFLDSRRYLKFTLSTLQSVQEVIVYTKLLNKMGHYFLDKQYIVLCQRTQDY